MQNTTAGLKKPGALKQKEKKQPSDKKDDILIVDDAPATLELLERNLSSVGYGIWMASNVEEALRVIDSSHIDLVITDFKMPGLSGVHLARHIRENYNDMAVMIITAYPSVKGAVEAVKTGAEEYLAKPFTGEELLSAVKRVLRNLHIRRAAHASNKPRIHIPHGLIGESGAMSKISNFINKAARTSATVLISGESGTGKELVARAIHYKSERASAPFVPVNCGAIPEELLESELFGHIKGAFTGANETRAGFFQTADGGTIFLDEISETSLSMQVKLLRVLQDKEVCMVGATRTRKVDVRILASTNKNIPALIKKGQFREDLYYRINVITVELPPLRERQDDIFLLTRHFAAKFAEELGRTAPRFSDGALQVLRSYHWPGNVRELENIIQRLVVMTDEDVIDVPDLPSLMRFSAHQPAAPDRTLAAVEAEYIRSVLLSVSNNKTLAAKILDIDRKTLREKLGKAKPSASR
ncbi:MAG: sigma-54 dependent transcriptional regulator [Smithellaceae bacterium]|jgi:two-component system, NtrC family, response regulator HydG|nr:sigma-54 dependent transcriptional regulator [Smithellaceae bacterium]MDD3258445.1 sigma-54 dependent transcriptional regulator [Smithellaceae bacterium]MDD3848009.1 sigma-54 dependent transcriptional regulator [Smithellaceae bacterium]HOQ71398.1 sigma-54 dependent transcriptional regulator [Smithellaceae bacterium]HPL09843.1 sigma-54 dependent transcriptional regulator [Smithellaceae bacterium]